MSLAPRQLLSQRLQCDEQILATLDAHAATLEHARQDALANLAAAQASLVMIEAELDDISTRRAAVAESVGDLRDSLRPSPMDAFPLELLRAVFMELAYPPDDLWPHASDNTSINMDRSRQPFDLAAVCRRWRDLAIATPPLWSYIGIPAPGLQPERRSFYYVYWVNTLLHRSKSAPLDICLLWADDEWEPNSCASKIIDAIAAHSLRWRHFQYDLPIGALTWDTMAIFRRPTPLLETFCLVGDDDACALDWDSLTPFPRYLPECPRLVRFRSDYTNVLHAVPRQPLSSLLQLEICVQDYPCKVLWNILRLCPALEILNIQFSGDRPEDLEDVPEFAVRLGSLRELAMYNEVSRMFAAALDVLSLPVLRSLDTDPVGIRALVAFFQRCGQGITHLTVTDYRMDMDDAESIRSLRNLETLEVVNCVVEDEFLQALAVSDQWLLPKLEHISFKDVEIHPLDGDGLAHVVRARNVEAPGTSTAPCKIRSVVITDSPKIPDWLIAEVRYLLAEEVVIDFDADPAIVDMIATEQDEPEAQFTDDDGSSDTDSLGSSFGAARVDPSGDDEGEGTTSSGGTSDGEEDEDEDD